MSWARFDDEFPQDTDIDEYSIKSSALGLWLLIVCTANRRQNPRLPIDTIRRLPGGNKRNLAKLCEAGWLIEIEKGKAFFVRSLEKYAEPHEGKPGRRHKPFPPAPDPDPAPPVPPRIRAIRQEAGRKGGEQRAARMAKRRHPEPAQEGDLPGDFAKDMAKNVAKPVANEADFASKIAYPAGKNGVAITPVLPATHARASDPYPVSREEESIGDSSPFDLSPSAGNSGPPEGGGEPPAAERSKGNAPNFDPSLWQPLKRDQVNEVAAALDDTGSLRRLGELWDICDQAGRVGENLWAACFRATQSAQKRGGIRETPGAYFRGLMARKLGEAGRYVPVGTEAERNALQTEIAASLGAGDEAAPRAP